MQGQNFETYIDSIDKIDKLYTRYLETIKLLAISKNLDNLTRLKLKLFLVVLKCLLNKVFKS